MNVVAFGIYKYALELTVADLEGFLWFLQKPLLKPFRINLHLS